MVLLPQYKVPQNIDLEDKIVGPFTMKQFVYLLIGGGIDYGLFNYFGQFENGMPYFIVIAAPVTILTLALTFIKINDRPFEIFLLNLIFYLFIPKTRFWQKGTGVSPVLIAASPKKAPEASRPQKNLDELAKELDIKPPASSQATTPPKGKLPKEAAVLPRLDGLAPLPKPAAPNLNQPAAAPPPSGKSWFGQIMARRPKNK